MVNETVLNETRFESWNTVLQLNHSSLTCVVPSRYNDTVESHFRLCPYVQVTSDK